MATHKEILANGKVITVARRCRLLGDKGFGFLDSPFAQRKDSAWMAVRVERGQCAAGGSGVPAAEQLSGSGWTVLSLRIG